jgi:hypothetical protein
MEPNLRIDYQMAANLAATLLGVEIAHRLFVCIFEVLNLIIFLLMLLFLIVK